MTLGIKIGTVRVEPYDASWPGAFDNERQDLLKVLGGVVEKPHIEHIGSTAVPMLAAKPIIDVVIGLRDHAELSRALDSLIQHQRVYVKGANQPGMLFMAAGDQGSRSFHYHLVIYGTPAWRKVIVFRDYLRRHPGVAREYGELKSALAKEFADSRGKYMAAKGPALRAIMQRGFAEDGRRRSAAASRLALLVEEEEAGLEDAGARRSISFDDADLLLGNADMSAVNVDALKDAVKVEDAMVVAEVDAGGATPAVESDAIAVEDNENESPPLT